jgi:acyl dehydratase
LPPIVESEITLLEKIGEKTFRVPKTVGKEYANLCNDYNPIHISTIAAKLFGFKSAIAHGMWVVGNVMGTSMAEFMEFQHMFEHLEGQKAVFFLSLRLCRK